MAYVVMVLITLAAMVVTTLLIANSLRGSRVRIIPGDKTNNANDNVVVANKKTRTVPRYTKNLKEWRNGSLK